jgi:hypothetical protein
MKITSITVSVIVALSIASAAYTQEALKGELLRSTRHLRK